MLSSLNPTFQDQKFDFEDANLCASNRFPTALPSFFEGVRQFARPLPWASGLLQAGRNCQSQSQLRLQVHRQVAQRNLVKLRNKDWSDCNSRLYSAACGHSLLFTHFLASLLFLFSAALHKKTTTERMEGGLAIDCYNKVNAKYWWT